MRFSLWRTEKGVVTIECNKCGKKTEYKKAVDWYKTFSGRFYCSDKCYNERDMQASERDLYTL